MTTSTDEPLERAVGAALRETDATLAVAESCTGGLLGARLTAVPGASDYFERGFVTYSNDAKLATLGVRREALDEHGAVSEPVARQMAQGARDAAGTTWAVSITGIAGPTGGTPEKPVGTVYVGVAHAGAWGSAASYARATRREFDGDRASVREQSVDDALALLLDAATGRVE